MKKNILIINRIDYKNYLKNELPIIDPLEHNVFIITKKEEAIQIPSEHYVELYAINTSDDKRVIDIAQKIHNEHKIDKVVALSERNLLTAAQIRDRLNVPGMRLNQALLFRNKLLMKEKLKKNDIKVPNYMYISNSEEVISFFNQYKKIVIKPVYGMGSQNTYIIESLDELQQTLKSLDCKTTSYEVEEFIDGEMYHCDSIVLNSEIKLVSVSKYVGSTLNYNGDHSLSSIMEDDSNRIKYIKDYNCKILDTLSFAEGVTHLELFVSKDGEITFCEIAARPGGGGIIEGIEQIYNVNLMEAAIRIEVDGSAPEITSSEFLSGFIMFYSNGGFVSKISGIEQFNKAWLPRFDINVKLNNFYNPASYSSDCIASFTVIGRNRKEIRNRISWVKNRFKVIFE